MFKVNNKDTRRIEVESIIPTDSTCQWATFSFVIFHVVKEKVCRKSFCDLCMVVSEYFDFEMEKRRELILSTRCYCTFY